MTEKLKDHHLRLLREIIQRENFTNYALEVDVGAVKGDNYLGEIISVKVKEKDSNKALNLIIKAALTGDMVRSKAPVRKAYQREILLYTRIFKEYEDLQEELQVTDKFQAVAKCYGALLEENQECIILEDLRDNGYKLWNRKKPMNSSHVTQVFKEYGKLHALSYALRHHKPKVFKELSEDLKDIFTGTMSEEELLEATGANFNRAFRAVENDQVCIAALKRFASSVSTFFKTVVPTKDRFSVITHGDCWCNNMMFAYGEAKSKPVKMCFLDWQLSKLGSPVLDLSYFLYSCGSKSDFDNLQYFLQVYYDSLSKALKQLDCNVRDTLTFDELFSQWRTYSKYGLYMAIMVIKIMVSESDEAPELDKMAKNGKNMLEMFDIDSIHNDVYNKRIRDIILSMNKYKFI